jgi:hypothetical protein
MHLVEVIAASGVQSLCGCHGRGFR